MDAAGGGRARGERCRRIHGRCAPSLKRDLDLIWMGLAKENWAKRHRELVQGRARVAELEAKADLRRKKWSSEPASSACSTEAPRPWNRGRPICAHPDFPLVLLDYGRSLLLDQDDAAGLVHVERAMEMEPSSGSPA